uniref:Uncharacterized protein n=1 Tax=Catagonus wagneri TaxID=51154 RepID=A0A8C3WPP3_9CETA
METQRASLCLGRWSLWLLLLGLVVPPASAQALSYRQAVLRAVDRLNKQSSGANLYRLLELDQLPKADEDLGTLKPVSFTVKETLCDFKENGLVKQCVGTVTLDQVKRHVDITCNEVSSPFLVSMVPLMGGVRRGGAELPYEFPSLCTCLGGGTPLACAMDIKGKPPQPS